MRLGELTKFDSTVIAHLEDIERTENMHGRPLGRDRRGRERKEKFPGFFGNIGGNQGRKFSIYDRIQVDITSTKTDLLRQIEANLEAFFATHNFGMRQSKGFGSFYLSSSDAKVYDPVKLAYQFSVDVSKMNSIKSPHKEFYKYYELFRQINLFYSTLRGGININSLYFKSLLFIYTRNHNWQWDKKTIKQHFYPRELTGQENKYFPPHKEKDPEDPLIFSSQTNYLFRDLLGLSTSQQWWKPYNDRHTRKSYDRKNGQTLYNRFKSPLFFKPIRTSPNTFDVHFEVPELMVKAFLEGKGIPETEILGKRFRIETKNRTNQSLIISTPPTFDFDAFFKTAFSIDLANHVEAKFHKSEEFQSLKKIFAELKPQVSSPTP